MKRVVALSVIGGCAAAGFLLSQPAGKVCPPVNTPPSTPVASAASNLGFLETRDHRIELNAGGRYTIRTKDGKMVAEDVTLNELRARNPNLHQILERAMSPNRNNDARGIRDLPLPQVPFAGR